MITSTGELLCDHSVNCVDEKIQSDNSGNWRCLQQGSSSSQTAAQQASQCLVPYLVLSKTDLSSKEIKAHDFLAYLFLDVLTCFVTKTLTRMMSLKGIRNSVQNWPHVCTVWSQLQRSLCWYTPHVEAWAELHCLSRRSRLRACMLGAAVAQVIW